jgi:nucleoside 2-deoxyribosyltransferase
VRVYLCGPINGCTDEECKDWREYAKSALRAECVDPMVRDYRGRENEAVAEIVENDKADIDGCDALLVNYVKPSVGTSMEVLYAWERGKRVVVVAAPGIPISPWLRYHAALIYPTFTEAINALNGLGAA